MNTDASPLAFPDNFSSDEENFVLNLDGSRNRRKGLALEANGNEITLSTPITGVSRAHHWRNVNGDPAANIMVLQYGQNLLFFDDDVSITATGNLLGTVDLTDYKVSTATDDEVAGSYVNTDYGRGHLFVVGAYIEPLYIVYESGVFSVNVITIEERDFDGIDDGIGNTVQPTTATPEHLYNLRNAGWTTTQITDFETSQSKYPSKNMMPWMGMVGETTSNVAEKDWTKAFSPAKLVAELFQDVAAPKGHYIRNACNTEFVVTAESLSYDIETWDLSALTGGNVTMYVRTTEPHGLATNDPIAITGHQAIYSVPLIYIMGHQFNLTKTWSADNYYNDITVPTSTISGATSANPIEFTTSTNHSLRTGDEVNFASLPGDFGTNLNGSTAYAVTKTAANKFTIAVNGSGYGAYSSGGTATGINCFTIPVETPVITPNGWTTQYSKLGTVHSEFDTNTQASLASRRPTSVAFFAGRVWYAGIQAPKLSHKVFYSQIVENDSQYGKCYQVADPTSELISDLVATDGGMISIPEMDTVLEIMNYSGKLLVIADNGIWEIGGGDRGYFTATGYSVRQLSNSGCASGSSVVIADGTPVYLGDSAIYAIQQDPNLGFLFTQDISTGKIQKLLATISKNKKSHVQAAYDRNSKKIYWLYDTDSADEHVFSNWLVLDMRLGSFSKFSNKGSLHLRSIYDIELYQDDTNEQKNIKFICDNTARDTITVAELRDESFEDFGTDAAAYVETGNDGIGDVSRRHYGRYLFTYMKRTETGYTGAEGSTETNPSGCQVRYLWNWVDSSTSGAWSNYYSAYRKYMRKYRNPLVDGTGTDLMGEPIAVSKNKIRGSGKVLRLRYDSEAGKNCHIYGWHLRHDVGAES